ncbi:4-aminobutyrate aminotransferase-like enzyme/Ser/Thr protein kinase RdoA (MazF antagonist) [Microbacterium proteolyticum]|uniref:4-aminobutyrate aminotransferase-like enzyme/Ser/Thr protein kinase RdoA (MazF antagonist) n=1 Tax=Microbacterium proteolyticum TaxID=1572644 RepID=A0A7W5CH84_9MICO|nr:aminotransferase [Microbacterium proteolyticum]MBB3157648.1 4-aminobutyrate aminotransferase-like enzyme/Ser/Thr protein kinase RdoA (MazF antagonist) [Microbacterium proteolyticum]
MSDSTPFLLRRPDVDDALAGELAAMHWGAAGAVHELGSQQDRNFALTGGGGAPSLLLKIHHPSTTAQEIDLQVVVARHLVAAGVPTPVTLPAQDGATTVAVTDREGAGATARALELVDGRSLADAPEFDGAIAEELGRFAGRTVAALAPFAHPAAERGIQWEMRRAFEVVETLVDELPVDRRDASLGAAREAAARVDAVAASLPLQVIHGDLTADNVLRGAGGGLSLVDLGDVGRSWRVAEIAILAADVLGRTQSIAQVGRAVRGFVSEVDLTDDELDVLWPMVVLRGAVLAVSGASQLRIDADNDYARERFAHELSVHDLSAGVAHDVVTSQLRLAAGRPHRRGTAYVPLVDGLADAAIVDLGIDSPALDEGRWRDAEAEDRAARDAAAARAGDAPGSGTRAVAVARFGEARLTRVPWDVAAPTAARARFVELWAPAGATVRAPFAGRVVSFPDAVELDDRGVVLRVEGLASIPPVSEVRAGDELGAVSADGARLRVSRRVAGAEADDAFVGPTGEFETDGALDPSPILGVEPVRDPVIVLRETRAARDRAMGGASERYYVSPPQIERGWDTRLIDARGRAYLDMVNNVTAIGHCHPAFVRRVSRQLGLLNTNSRFLFDAYARYTERLLAHFPRDRFDTVLPVNSGSEAVDLALRLAQLSTGRRDVIALREGYHGWTMGADAVTTSAFDNPAALQSRPEWVHLADAPNPYRGAHRGGDSGAAYAEQVAELASRLTREGRAPAAFISEPVLGNAGGVVPPPGYLPAAYDAIRAHGGLAIADEVQVGLGRLGSTFWGWEMLGAVPDIVTVAKAAGNAYPVGAVVTRREIVEALREEGMFFSSAGGAPAGAVAGVAVLDVIADEDLQGNALRVGAYLRNALETLAERHPLIGTIHGSGLYLGIELVRDGLDPAVAETAEICERLLEEGVIMQPTSERSNVLKVKPPMTLTRDDADTFVAALDRVLRRVRR